MTSSSSGYFRMKRYLDLKESLDIWRTISVPSKSRIMISFIMEINIWVSVSLFRHGREYDSVSGEWTKTKIKMWGSNKFEHDLARVYNVNTTEISIHTSGCSNAPCFQLFFSFFTEHNVPEKLLTGFWNCSVEHYSSFHHHMACNLKAECEDGRDETEHCPFSSSHCQGLLDFCNRCYAFLDTDSKQTDLRQISYDCDRLGGKVTFPKCGDESESIFTTIPNRFWQRLSSFWVTAYSNDVSFPNMYRHSLHSDDKSVYHHSFQYFRMETGHRTCLFLDLFSYQKMYLGSAKCAPTRWLKVICEVKKKNNESTFHHLQEISLRSTQPSWPNQQEDIIACGGSHVTYTFLLCSSKQDNPCNKEKPSCYFSNQKSYLKTVESTHLTTPSLFTCSNGLAAISFTLICDFIPDCVDTSDESFCQHPLCLKSLFTCANHQCLSYSKVCDQLSDCQDNSDEKDCHYFRRVDVGYDPVPFPAFVDFNGVSHFVSKPLNGSEPCPASHYVCPGEFRDCLPVYTRCNGIYDCIEHWDEDNCEDITCPGFYRCRLSKLCLHRDHICDGWSHCPLNDDELWCAVACPVQCLCQGHSVLCPQPFQAALFPQLRFLDGTGSGMTLSDVSSHVYLIHLVLAKCSMTLLPEIQLLNLKFLDLSGNQLHRVNVTSFLGLLNLQSLVLSGNPVELLYRDDALVPDQDVLRLIDLSYTTLTILHSAVFAHFPHLQKLNLTFTAIHTISPDGFRFIPRLTELYMHGSPMKTFSSDIFQHLSFLEYVSTDNYKLCCAQILPDKFDTLSCDAPEDEISSCEDLLQSWVYRASLWMIGCMAITGNVFCFCARLVTKSLSSTSSYSVFVTNLTLADFLMGVYIAVIGVADQFFRGQYLYNDDAWKHSVMCQVAGFLSLLSGEVSALIVWLITLDRFIVLCFPFSTLRFERKSSAVVCLLIWMAGCCLALLPLLPVTSHWEFYSQTSICIPLPVTRQVFQGKSYSFGVLIVLNFVLFLFISLGQAFIYWSIQKNALKTNSTKLSKDLTIARRLIMIVLTDFLCWFPIGLCGFLALGGVPIHGEVNVGLAIFVLPLNSAINPFMYTFNILAEKRRKLRETKLLKWMESYADDNKQIPN